jgi:hypothetical protein
VLLKKYIQRLESMMPNGLSGYFGLSKDELGRILRALPVDETVCRPPIDTDYISVSELIRMISESSHDPILIEEHDYFCYVILLEELKKWVLVWEKSLLHDKLREQHMQKGRSGTKAKP